MPKIKIPRKNISLDMTAMCDMAFLLLTFFMLATKFKPQEAVAVDMPSSVSNIPLPDKEILLISVRNDGAIFFGVDSKHTRLEILEAMGKKYGIQFTEKEKKDFSLMESFGVPMNKLKAFLATNSESARKSMQTGISADSLKNELGDWVFTSEQVTGNHLKIAIKGDRGSNYEVVEDVIARLRELEIYKFNLITMLENKPQ